MAKKEREQPEKVERDAGKAAGERPEAALDDEDLEAVSGGTAPRDISTGQAVGRRIHKPIVIIHE